MSAACACASLGCAPQQPSVRGVTCCARARSADARSGNRRWRAAVHVYGCQLRVRASLGCAQQQPSARGATGARVCRRCAQQQPTARAAMQCTRCQCMRACAPSARYDLRRAPALTCAGARPRYVRLHAAAPRRRACLRGGVGPVCWRAHGAPGPGLPVTTLCVRERALPALPAARAV
eukprot:4839067-Pleurochrysis_carterae.AAC.1